MADVIRVSEAASLGMHTVVLLARDPDRVFSTKEVAAKLGASEAHLAKVMQRLARAGLVVSVRGPKGGFRLAPGKGQSTMMEVYECIEGPFSARRCLLGEPACEGKGCILGGLLEAANQQVEEYLTDTTIEELTGVYGGQDGS